MVPRDPRAYARRLTPCPPLAVGCGVYATVRCIWATTCRQAGCARCTGPSWRGPRISRAAAALSKHPFSFEPPRKPLEADSRILVCGGTPLGLVGTVVVGCARLGAIQNRMVVILLNDFEQNVTQSVIRIDHGFK